MFDLIFKIISRSPKAVLAITLLITVAAGIYAVGIFGDLSEGNGFNASGTEAQRVSEQVAKSFPNRQPTAVVLVSTFDSSLRVSDPAYRAEVERITRPLVQDGATVDSFYTTGLASLVSNDQKKTYLLVTIPKGEAKDKYETLTTWQDNVSSPDVVTSLGGELVSQQQSSKQVESDLKLAEAITLPVLAILLVIIFGGIVAGSLPLVLGIVSIVGAIAVVRALTGLTEIDQYALNIITILGLGLSVDYSLLMVSRFREELNSGHDKFEAVRRTVLTSGRTIFFSGLTVIASLLALTIFPLDFLRSVGLGGTSAIIVSVFSALVILPALLLVMGDKINALQVRKLHPAKPGKSVWARITRVATSHPVIAILGTIIFVAALAYPLLGAKLATVDYRTLPTGSSARDVAQTLDNEFGDGQNTMLALYKPQSSPTSSAGIASTYALTQKLSDVEGVLNVDSPTPPAGGSAAFYQAAYSASTVAPQLKALQASNTAGDYVLLTVRYRGDVASSATSQLLERLRSVEVPSGSLEIGGEAAGLDDTVNSIVDLLPYAGLIIAVAMFMLLSLLLRSIIIPIQAIVINSFALIAAFGILILIFQDGWLTQQTWLAQTGGLTLAIPILIFAIAFGLSMDYAAFLYSRMREEYDRDGDTKQAIAHAIDKTGSIITSAAMLLFVVVVAFASSKIAFLQQVGLGLSLAVLLDAFIIRLILVPAVMTLFGRVNWYAPKWMSRFSIRHE